MQGDFDRARSLQARARAIYEELGLRFRLASRFLPAQRRHRDSSPGVRARQSRSSGRPTSPFSRWARRASTATMAAFLADALSQDGKHDEADEVAGYSEEHAPAERRRDPGALANGESARPRRARERERPNGSRDRRLRLARDTDYPDLKARALTCLAEVRRARRRAVVAARRGPRDSTSERATWRRWLGCPSAPSIRRRISPTQPTERSERQWRRPTKEGTRAASRMRPRRRWRITTGRKATTGKPVTLRVVEMKVTVTNPVRDYHVVLGPTG